MLNAFYDFLIKKIYDSQSYFVPLTLKKRKSRRKTIFGKTIAETEFRFGISTPLITDYMEIPTVLWLCSNVYNCVSTVFFRAFEAKFINREFIKHAIQRYTENIRRIPRKVTTISTLSEGVCETFAIRFLINFDLLFCNKHSDCLLISSSSLREEISSFRVQTFRNNCKAFRGTLVQYFSTCLYTAMGLLDYFSRHSTTAWKFNFSI